MLSLEQYPHRRYNPLLREWVLVSPQRTERPWQGQTEEMALESLPEYDETCYLCPGNKRAGGTKNPDYTTTFVFENDYPALRPDTPAGHCEEDLLIAEAEPGVCRVVCFSPRHDLTISRMSVEQIRLVVDTWAEQYRELGRLPFVNWVQIFENRGAMMGASNPHPHGQIWAQTHPPNELNKEWMAQTEYITARQRCLLCDYLAMEQKSEARLVCENMDFYIMVPFWAIWPFETMIVSKRHVTGLDDLTSRERDNLAEILKRVTAGYDRLFRVSFPYTMGFHQKPTDGESHDEWHLHSHFYPPLLRSATVRKFMVGYELLAMPQRDVTPESAAARLRAVQT